MIESLIPDVSFVTGFIYLIVPVLILLYLTNIKWFSDLVLWLFVLVWCSFLTLLIHNLRDSDYTDIPFLYGLIAGNIIVAVNINALNYLNRLKHGRNFKGWLLGPAGYRHPHKDGFTWWDVFFTLYIIIFTLVYFLVLENMLGTYD